MKIINEHPPRIVDSLVPTTNAHIMVKADNGIKFRITSELADHDKSVKRFTVYVWLTGWTSFASKFDFEDKTFANLHEIVPLANDLIVKFFSK